MLSNIIKKISESLIQKLNFFLFLLPIISILLIYLLNLYFTVKNNYLFPIFFGCDGVGIGSARLDSIGFSISFF